ncbi:MAG: hypothetical protein JZU65_02625 [Chlorobium sp.]|nr:hypothetical protein [Chlorobium sp.]
MNYIHNVEAEVPDNVTMIEIAPINGLLMNCSLFKGKNKSAANPFTLDYEKFSNIFLKRDIRPNKDGPMFAPADFKESRSKENFLSASGICFDFDKGKPFIVDILGLFPMMMAAYYSTHSSTPDSPRFRVVIPLSRPVNADEHARLVLGIKNIIPPKLLECLDETCFQKERAHYLPSCPSEQEINAFSGFQDGNPLDVDHFILLGNIAAAVETELIAPSPAFAQEFESMATVPTRYEFIDQSTGEIYDLVAWAANNPTFNIVTAVDPKYRIGKLKDGKQHIKCPFEGQHSGHVGDDMATFIANASPPQYVTWAVLCCHNHCAGRDRLDFLRTMLEQGWFSTSPLQIVASVVASVPLELKHPSFANYPSTEIAKELQLNPLLPEEFRIHLHLTHLALLNSDGTLEDNDWKTARALSIPTAQWLEFKINLIDSGWQVSEYGRLFNPITRREFQKAQAALMAKTEGGRLGGKASSAKRAIIP